MSIMPIKINKDITVITIIAEALINDRMNDLLRESISPSKTTGRKRYPRIDKSNLNPYRKDRIISLPGTFVVNSKWLKRNKSLLKANNIIPNKSNIIQ